MAEDQQLSVYRLLLDSAATGVGRARESSHFGTCKIGDDGARTAVTAGHHAADLPGKTAGKEWHDALSLSL